MSKPQPLPPHVLALERKLFADVSFYAATLFGLGYAKDRVREVLTHGVEEVVDDAYEQHEADR